MRKTLVTLGVLLVVLVSYKWFFSSVVMQCQKTPRTIKGFTELLLPPPDLYLYVAKKSIQSLDSNSENTLKFKHKYEGGYEIDLLMPGYFQEYSGRQLKTALTTRIEFASNGKTLLTKITKGPYDAFLSGKYEGVILSTYTVGEDLPVAEEIECRIWILECDTALLDKIRKSEFAIRRFYNL